MANGRMNLLLVVSIVRLVASIVSITGSFPKNVSWQLANLQAMEMQM